MAEAATMTKPEYAEPDYEGRHRQPDMERDVPRPPKPRIVRQLPDPNDER